MDYYKMKDGELTRASGSNLTEMLNAKPEVVQGSGVVSREQMVRMIMNHEPQSKLEAAKKLQETKESITKSIQMICEDEPTEAQIIEMLTAVIEGLAEKGVSLDTIDFALFKGAMATRHNIINKQIAGINALLSEENKGLGGR